MMGMQGQMKALTVNRLPEIFMQINEEFAFRMPGRGNVGYLIKQHDIRVAIVNRTDPFIRYNFKL